MLARYARELRSVTTFGIAIFGPLSLVSFLIVLVTSVGGVPPLVLASAVLTIPLLVLSVAVYVAVDLTERYQRPGSDEVPADDEDL